MYSVLKHDKRNTYTYNSKIVNEKSIKYNFCMTYLYTDVSSSMLSLVRFKFKDVFIIIYSLGVTDQRETDDLTDYYSLLL